MSLDEQKVKGQEKRYAPTKDRQIDLSYPLFVYPPSLFTSLVSFSRSIFSFVNFIYIFLFAIQLGVSLLLPDILCLYSMTSTSCLVH